MSIGSRLVRFVRALFVRRTRRAMREIERLKRMINMVDATSDTEIACDEAYRLLDEFAEMLLRGENVASLMPEVQHHLEMCLNCKEELEALLLALKATPV